MRYPEEEIVFTSKNEIIDLPAEIQALKVLDTDRSRRTFDAEFLR